MSVMLAKFLPDKLTVLTAREAILALRSAYETLEGVTPSPECLSLHTAQAMLEAARFRSCHNYCFTNAKASTTYQGFFNCYKCNEKLADGWHWYVPEGELIGSYGTPLKGAPIAVPDGHPQTRFRAFLSAEAGALDHMALEKRKFPEAYTAARAGDPVGFVHGLKIRTFFTADEAPYLAGVSSLQREVLPLCRDLTAKHIEIVTDEEICRGMACVAPDPERALHNEAVVAMLLSQQGIDDWQREERKANLREPE
jgi:hypothetical protein